MEADSAEPIGKLREQLAAFQNSQLYRDIVGPKDQVLARFQPIFSPDHVSAITRDEFLSFLLFQNNRHWTGLHRQGNRICADMQTLQSALHSLLDESRPIADRLNEAIEAVFGMGKNVATAILLVAHPDKYGVWNNQSEAVLKRFALWPEFERGESLGERYLRVNQVLLRLSNDLGIDLWTLDAYWWFFDRDEADDLIDELEAAETIPDLPIVGAGEVQHTQRFALERHLHVFLRDNWNSLDLARDWTIYAEPGDDEKGYEYPTNIGRIDLLARHRREPRWLVVELKREQSADQTVGQVLRYMGWVSKHLAKPDETVSGLIICRAADASTPYALSMVPNVQLRTYEVQFHLRSPGEQA